MIHSKRVVTRLLVAIMLVSATYGVVPRGQVELDGATPDLVIVNMADTHSAYDAYPAILAGVRELSMEYGGRELVFLFNGDIFELGNATATKSGGIVDAAFLRRLGDFGTVVINIGNHEFDFMSPEQFVNAAEEEGAVVIGTVATANDAVLTPAFTDIPVAGRTVRIVGIGTDQINTYPGAIRESLVIPDPVAWTAANWDRVTRGADYSIMATHAGLVADLAMIGHVAGDDSILYVVGGHDHIVVRENVRGIDYMHNGFRGERLNVTEVFVTPLGAYTRYRDILTADIDGEDATLAALVEDVRSDYLDAEDLAVIGRVPRDKTVLEAAMWSVETVREATGADAAFLNHTSFGSGLVAGPFTKYRFDQFMRFDNDVMRATVDADTMRTILAHANQHEMDDLSGRTGDFLYTGGLEVRDGRTYEIVTSSWVALDFNQMRYLGTTVEFEKIPDITTKGLLIEALN